MPMPAYSAYLSMLQKFFSTYASLKYVEMTKIYSNRKLKLPHFLAASSTQIELHAKTTRYNIEHAFYPSRLAGGSGRRIQTPY